MAIINPCFSPTVPTSGRSLESFKVYTAQLSFIR